MSDRTIPRPADRRRFSLHHEDDIPHDTRFMEQTTDLKQALRQTLPDWFVARDFAVYWVPGETKYPYLGLDVLVARNRPPQDDPSVFLTYEDGPLSLVVEVTSLSPPGARRQVERPLRKALYATTLRVPEYLFIDPNQQVMRFHKLVGDRYEALFPDARGRFWSRELPVGFAWQEDRRRVRLLTPGGSIVPTPQEEAALRAAAEQRTLREAQRAEQAAQQAEREAQRAESEAAQRANAEARARAAEQAATAERTRAEALAAELERLRREMRQRCDPGQ